MPVCRWLPAVLALVLAACAGDAPPLDEPATVREPNVIEIMPVDGVPTPMARLLATALVEAMADRGAPVRLNEGGPPGDDVRMVVTGAAFPGDTAGDGRIATLDWQVHARNRTTPVITARLPVHGEEAAWTYGSPALIDAIGERTAELLGEAIGLASGSVAETVDAPAEPDPVPTEVTDTEAAVEAQSESEPIPSAPSERRPPPRLWIDEVTGSPGDGNKALTLALTELIRNAGYPMARTPSAAEYYVQAVVDVSVIDNSTETVKIVWSIVGRDGEEKGKITQSNDIPRGMLHGEWGETARYAALGGFEGVRAILHELGYEAPEP